MHASYDPCFELNPTSTSSPALNHLEYLHCAAENLVEEGRQFDVVCAMEVLEHVDDPAGFLRCVSDLTKVRPISPPSQVYTDAVYQPGGLLLISTINRTPLSQLLSITMAEDVLRLVTPKTHTYSKFVRPEELAEFFEEAGWGAIEKRGCIYDPIYGGWRLLGAGDFGGLGEQCNYFMGIKKPL
jgi:polyprenyldihydroxybenzoate methyltransferase/3-demethylubiquinol 3-O-methyltransferase